MPPDHLPKTGHEPAAFLDRLGLAPCHGDRHRRLRARCRRSTSRTPSYALQDTAARPGSARRSRPRLGRHPGLSGVEASTDGRSRRHALSRSPRAARARSTSRPTSGRATDRNPAVRRGAAGGRARRARAPAARRRQHAGMDPMLALLDAQPSIEVRLYNPFVGRGSRGLGLLGDFQRLNRRMHNKSFTVDNQVSMVGGRNIADEYFEAGQEPASPTSTSWRRRRRARGVDGVRSVLEQPSAYPGAPPPRATWLPGSAGVRAPRPGDRGGPAIRASTPTRSRTAQVSGPARGSCTSSGRRRVSCTTIRQDARRRAARSSSAPAEDPGRVRLARPRSTWSRRTSSPATPEPRPCRPGPPRRAGARADQLAGRDRRGLGARRL